MMALGIFLLIALNVQFLIFLTMAENWQRRSLEKMKNDLSADLLKILSSMDENLKKNLELNLKESDFNRHQYIEIGQKLWGINKIYKLLILNEEEKYCEVQAEELGFSEILKKGDKEEIEKIVKMLMGRWELRKSQIER